MHTRTQNNFFRLLFSLVIMTVLSACQAMPNIKNDVVVHDEYVNKGDILPIGTITTIDGKVIDIHQLGKRKLIVLFATWCDDSNRLLTALNTSPMIADDSIEIIAIAREESAATVTAWRNKNDIKFAIAVDPGRQIYKNFASGGIPRVITVGQSNKIIQMNLAEGDKQLEKIVWK